jgi:hypothetical protein
MVMIFIDCTMVMTFIDDLTKGSGYVHSGSQPTSVIQECSAYKRCSHYQKASNPITISIGSQSTPVSLVGGVTTIPWLTPLAIKKQQIEHNQAMHREVVASPCSYTLEYLRVTIICRCTFFCDFGLERVLRVLNFAICTRKWYRVDIF